MKKKMGLLIIFFLFQSNSHAIFGGQGGQATEVTQILNNLELYNQTINMVDRLDNMIYNTEVLIDNPLAAFGVEDIVDRFYQVQDMIQRAEGIAYSMKNIDEVFIEKYRGYSSQLDKQLYSDEYAVWHETTMHTLQNTMKAAGVQMDKFEKEKLRLNEVLRISQSAQGRNALMQANNNINAVMMESLQDLKQLMALQLQQQNSYMASQEQKQAREKHNRLSAMNTDEITWRNLVNDDTSNWGK